MRLHFPEVWSTCPLAYFLHVDMGPASNACQCVCGLGFCFHVSLATARDDSVLNPLLMCMYMLASGVVQARVPS